MMATKKVDLKPIGRAMKRAKHDLQELAELASPDGKKDIRGRIKQLDILIRQLPKVCRAPVFKKPPVFTTAFCAKFKAFTIALQPARRSAIPATRSKKK
jgi:hypothetical protein